MSDTTTRASDLTARLDAMGCQLSGVTIADPRDEFETRIVIDTAAVEVLLDKAEGFHRLLTHGNEFDFDLTLPASIVNDDPAKFVELVQIRCQVPPANGRDHFTLRLDSVAEEDERV